MTLDNGGPFDQLLDKWTALDAGVPPAARREAAVSFVMRELGAQSRFTRALLEAAYDRLFPPAPETPGIVTIVVCGECGLNDGHHYAGCSKND